MKLFSWLFPSSQDRLEQKLRNAFIKQEKIMANLEKIMAHLIEIKTKLEAPIAAYKAIKDNQTPGPGPGEVIVKQADLDAADEVITGESAEIDAA